MVRTPSCCTKIHKSIAVMRIIFYIPFEGKGCDVQKGKKAMQLYLWENQTAFRAVATLLGVLGIALGTVTPTSADVINCGDVLGPGGRFQLEQDLTCPFSALTIRDGAILDLHGHRVTCTPPSAGFRCVVLTGKEAQLRNGTVAGGLHESITLEGTGGHTVRDVTSSLVDANILVTSDHNRLINVIAQSVYNAAFAIYGDHNRLTNSMALCPFVALDGCISIAGDENDLSDNLVSVEEDCCAPGVGRGGMRIAGHKNRLRLNRVTNHDGPGIVVLGTDNDLRFNTALGNVLDLQDMNGDCTHNTWKHNIFDTSDPPCIGAGVAKVTLMAK